MIVQNTEVETIYGKTGFMQLVGITEHELNNKNTCTCYQEFAAYDFEDIKELRGIIGKHIYWELDAKKMRMNLMKYAFIYKNKKSDKFWNIDYSGVYLCVHYGKVGTTGKFEIKVFDTEEECEEEAKKFIESKKKGGYVENTGFNFNNCIYIDDEEYGLHPKTSHPLFRTYFTDDFYYDCGDEQAPFGSDEGSDTLYFIERKVRKNSNFDFLAFPKYLIEDEWGMTYIPANSLVRSVIDEIVKTQKIDMEQSDMITYATAFAQIKTTGKLNADLKQRALYAIKRLAFIYSDGELTKTQQKMYDDLLSF